MKDTDLYSRILGLATRGLLPTSSWTRQEAVWMSMLSMLPASYGAARCRAQDRPRSLPHHAARGPSRGQGPPTGTS